MAFTHLGNSAVVHLCPALAGTMGRHFRAQAAGQAWDGKGAGDSGLCDVLRGLLRCHRQERSRCPYMAGASDQVPAGHEFLRRCGSPESAAALDCDVSESAVVLTLFDSPDRACFVLCRSDRLARPGEGHDRGSDPDRHDELDDGLCDVLLQRGLDARCGLFVRRWD